MAWRYSTTEYGRGALDRTWTVVGVCGSPRVPSSGIPREEDQVGPCEQLDALSPFNPLSYRPHPVSTGSVPRKNECRTDI
ncbi:unnamed protein product [Prunus armeniaca]